MGRSYARHEECPHCGETFPAGRLACPACGSDARTGWKDAEEIDYASVDLPEADDTSRTANTLRRGRPLFWLALAAALVSAVVLATR